MSAKLGKASPKEGPGDAAGAAAPASFEVGDQVTVQGKLGTVKFFGETKFAGGVWVGIDLDEAVGKNNGHVQGVQYFTCEDQHGIFVRPAQCVAAKGAAKAKAGPAKARPKSMKSGSANLEKPAEGASAASSQPPKSPRVSQPASKAGSSATAAEEGEAPATLKPPPAPRAAGSATPKTLSQPKQPPKAAGAKAAGASASAAPPPPPKPEQESEEQQQMRGLTEEAGRLEQSLKEVTADANKMAAEHMENEERMRKLENDNVGLAEECNQCEAEEKRLLEEDADLETRIDELRKAARKAFMDAFEKKEEKEEKEPEKAEIPEKKEKKQDEDGQKEDGQEEEGEEAPCEQQAQEDELEKEQEMRRHRMDILRLKGQIQVQRSAKELADLRHDEAEILLEEVQEEIAEARQPEFFAPDQQVEWHKEAINHFVQDHQHQMKRLKQKEGELLRERERAAEADKQVDMEALRKLVETRKTQFEAKDKESKLFEKVIEERVGIKRCSKQLDDVIADHETELKEEIQRHQRRVWKLEGLAALFLKGREDLKKRHEEAEAEVARLEMRMQTVKAQKDALPSAGQQQLAVPATATELEAVRMQRDARAGTVKATAFSWCLPAWVKDEADLGTSFTTQVALHRVFAKAQILTCAIHRHYIQDASLAVLQSSAPLEWLCHTCLAAALIAYSSASVLGRLVAASADQYRKVTRSPALKSCSGGGEKALDAAIAVVVDALMDSLGPKGGPREVLSTLKALGQQLSSVEKAAFKDDPFASWQSAGCAVEACRAACAIALYASDDAGGSFRERWKQLYSKADQTRQRIGRLEGKRESAFDMEPNMLAKAKEADGVDDVAGSKETAEATVKGQETPAASPASSPAKTETAATPKSAALASPKSKELTKQLDQNCMDLLLLQVKQLQAFTDHDPLEDSAEADELNHAFKNADAQLDVISTAVREKLKSKDSSSAGDGEEMDEEAVKPWLQARAVMSQRTAEADRNSSKEYQVALDNLKVVEKNIKAIEEKLEAKKKELNDVERSYGRARVEAERSGVTEEIVTRMRGQVKSHEAVRHDLETSLQAEQNKAREVEQDMRLNKKKHAELQAQLATTEARIKKKYSTGVSPEEVIALRKKDLALRHRLLETRSRRDRGVLSVALQPQRHPDLQLIPELFEEGKEKVRAKKHAATAAAAPAAAVAAAAAAEAAAAAPGENTGAQAEASPAEAGAMDKTKTDAPGQEAAMSKTKTEIKRDHEEDHKNLEELAHGQDIDIVATWERLRSLQGGLLREKASSQIVELDAKKPGIVVAQQRLRLEAINFETAQIKHAVNHLMKERMEVPEHIAGEVGGYVGSVPFSRYLRDAVNESQHGACMKVTLPKSYRAVTKGYESGVLPTCGSGLELQALHRAMMP
eukprot:TRINITY_DN36282_c0_g1_i1.p1 TRINITY_DN36282_c0_g1~~TRINITY_DN36282_c0_g1_i1.p1  ORF type:complete len:1395 (+),score=544.42 TRINITY_DN36282_c0_g1_i1:208-4392(+)